MAAIGGHSIGAAPIAGGKVSKISTVVAIISGAFSVLMRRRFRR